MLARTRELSWEHRSSTGKAFYYAKRAWYGMLRNGVHKTASRTLKHVPGGVHRAVKAPSEALNSHEEYQTTHLGVLNTAMLLHSCANLEYTGYVESI